MEKTGSLETVVFKEDGKVKVRLPGGAIIPSDGTIKCPLLSEGEYHVVKEDEDGLKA